MNTSINIWESKNKQWIKWIKTEQKQVRFPSASPEIGTLSVPIGQVLPKAKILFRFRFRWKLNTVYKWEEGGGHILSN